MKVFILISIFLLPLLAFSAKNKQNDSQPQTLGEIEVGYQYENIRISGYGVHEWNFVVAASGTYRLSLTNLQSDMSALVFDQTYVTFLQCDEYLDNSDEICEMALTEGTEYFIRIYQWSSQMLFHYNLLVAPVVEKN